MAVKKQRGTLEGVQARRTRKSVPTVTVLLASSRMCPSGSVGSTTLSPYGWHKRLLDTSVSAFIYIVPASTKARNIRNAVESMKMQSMLLSTVHRSGRCRSGSNEKCSSQPRAWDVVCSGNRWAGMRYWPLRRALLRGLATLGRANKEEALTTAKGEGNAVGGMKERIWDIAK